MNSRNFRSCKFLLPMFALSVFVNTLDAQQDKVAALKQSIAANQKQLAQYKWVETTVISMKGEEKSRSQKQCYYGPDGKVQKQPLSAPPPKQPAPGGLKGKVVEKKKEELTDYMKQATGLIHQYVPPDPQRIQTVKAAGGLSASPTGPGSSRLEFKNYLKQGDSLSLSVDTAANSIQTVNVRSYLESQSDAISLDVTFARLREGVSYPGNIVLNAPAKQIQVVIQNSNYVRLTPAAAPVSQAAPPGASAQGIDALTAPIALYPDALIAQILTASTNPAEVPKFSGWMAGNSTLTGSALQDAAQQAGFSAPLVALAPFPQVIQMMVQKPDWTQQLGKAFTADKNAVFDSIQRLRAQAQAAGNLKTNQQQQVQTETTSGGQQVIVVQPANPQVIYVPQYNPQTVYVQSPPPPGPNPAAVAAVAFTAGVIIGQSSNHYYHGPYAWHGAAMYNQAWEAREDYVDHRQDMYQDNAERRQDNYQNNSSQRQESSQANQSQRQQASSANQSQRQASVDTRQATAQGNVDSREAQAQGSVDSRQASADSRQSSAQASASGRQTQRQSMAGTSSYGGGQAASQRSGGGLSGYQGGASARAQSARGSGSLSGSRGSRR